MDRTNATEIKSRPLLIWIRAAAVFGAVFGLRTVVAMALRSTIWRVIAALGWHFFLRPAKP